MNLCEKHDDCYVIYEGGMRVECPICKQISEAAIAFDGMKERAEKAEDEVGDRDATISQLETNIAEMEAAKAGGE